MTTSTTLNESWRDHAACRGRPTSIFFPEPHDQAAVREAQRICAGCPVQESCGDYANRAVMYPPSADGSAKRIGTKLRGIWAGQGYRARNKRATVPVDNDPETGDET